jgi:hypothetical protein
VIAHPLELMLVRCKNDHSIDSLFEGEITIAELKKNIIVAYQIDTRFMSKQA